MAIEMRIFRKIHFGYFHVKIVRVEIFSSSRQVADKQRFNFKVKICYLTH